MAIVEQMELVRHRSDIIADVRHLLEKYRAIFILDVPKLDKRAADKLILVEIHKALGDLEKEMHLLERLQSSDTAP